MAAKKTTRKSTTTKRAPVKRKPAAKKPVRKPAARKAAKKKEEPKLLNQSQLAFQFGISRDIVRRRLNAAGVTKIKKGTEYLYDLEECRPFLETDEGINELKKRKLLAEAQEKEMKVAERRQELLSAAEVRNAVQGIFGSLHKELSIRMCKRIAAKLKAAKTVKDVNAILKPAITDVFNRLRDNHGEFLTDK